MDFGYWNLIKRNRSAGIGYPTTAHSVFQNSQTKEKSEQPCLDQTLPHLETYRHGDNQLNQITGDIRKDPYGKSFRKGFLQLITEPDGTKQIADCGTENHAEKV